MAEVTGGVLFGLVPATPTGAVEVVDVLFDVISPTMGGSSTPEFRLLFPPPVLPAVV